jgi:hypothetical protein
MLGYTLVRISARGKRSEPSLQNGAPIGMHVNAERPTDPPAEGSIDRDDSRCAAGSARHIATVGLHSSASTWVFNVLRELLIASFTETQITSCYADQLQQLPPEHLLTRRHLLVKSHHGSDELHQWLDARGFRFVLSIRDPRDAAVSMAQRFKTPLAFAAGWINDDCQRIMRLAPSSTLLFRYETRFFDQVDTVEQLAGHFDLTVVPSVMQSIFDRYSTDAVRDFALGLKGRSGADLRKIGQFVMDKVTQVTEIHIGDTRSGKWRELRPAMQARLTEIYAPFIERFGY